MSNTELRTSSIGSRATDIFVLTVSFLLFTMITEYENLTSLFIDLFLYVGIVFVCLRLSKRIIFQYVHSSKRCINILSGNIVGLAVGGLLVFTISQLVPVVKESVVVVVFSSVLAFFILGTLSPMIKSSHNDIISH